MDLLLTWYFSNTWFYYVFIFNTCSVEGLPPPPDIHQERMLQAAVHGSYNSEVTRVRLYLIIKNKIPV